MQLEEGCSSTVNSSKGCLLILTPRSQDVEIAGLCNSQQQPTKDSRQDAGCFKDKVLSPIAGTLILSICIWMEAMPSNA